jgi:ABC-type polysaccharide/polyol phosphate export permease
MDLFRYPINILKTNIKYFGQTLEMSRKDLKKQYSASVGGVLWGLAKPTLFIFVYWFAIEYGLRGGAPIEGQSYIFWLIPGIIAWFFILDCLNYGSNSIRVNRHLITKSVYPISTIPIFRVVSVFYIHLAMVIISVLIFLITGAGLSVYFVQIIYYLAAIFLFGSVLSLFNSALVVVSRDYEYFLKAITQLLFWLSPIIWSIEEIPQFIKPVVMLNPIAYFTTGYRNTFFNQEWFFENWQYTLYFWGFMLVFILITSFIFSRLENEFADIL